MLNLIKHIKLLFSLELLSRNKTAIFRFVIIQFSFTYSSYSQQNLIYNGDFEIFSSCPLYESNPTQNPKEITKCLGWNTPTHGTGDYFNSCSNNPGISIPINYNGIQNAFNGNGYVGGFFTNYTGGAGSDGYSGPMWWEYIQGTLIQPLEAGKFYKLSMELSLAELSDLMINEIGAYFSENPIVSSNTASLQVNPQCTFFNPTFFIDTLNWMHVEAIFIANGGEKHITIGNFKDNISTDTIRRYDLSPTADNPYKTYFYIDNVVLTEAFEFIDLPNVFTPNGDGNNDLWFLPFNEGPGNHTLTIVNRWGNVIYEGDTHNFAWDGKTLNGEICSSGIYFYRISNTKIAGFIELIK